MLTNGTKKTVSLSEHTHTHTLYSQLRYDGYENAAQAVSHVIASYPRVAPSSRLSHLVQLGMKTEGEGRTLA